MKKKLLILVCLVFAIGACLVATGVQNSVLIQNVLACENDEDDCSGDDGGSGGSSHGCAWEVRDSTRIRVIPCNNCDGWIYGTTKRSGTC